MLSIIFEVLALLMPVRTVIALTFVFGAYAMVDGIFSLVSGVNNIRKGKRWSGLIFSGVLGIMVGIIVLVVPQVASIGLTSFFWAMFAIWAIATGAFELSSAFRLRREMQKEWLLALNGLLSILLGMGALILFWLNPLGGIVVLGWLIGGNALASGVLLLSLAFKFFKNTNRLPGEKQKKIY